jgi:hypothetical protein
MLLEHCCCIQAFRVTLSVQESGRGDGLKWFLRHAGEIRSRLSYTEQALDCIQHAVNSMGCCNTKLAKFSHDLHFRCRARVLQEMMMMILHHIRHGRQDNHATNHVQKRARQGKAEGISRPNKAKPYTSETCGVQRLPSKAVEKHHVNAYGGMATAMHGNLDANKQERMMRANFIPALCWDWQIVPGKIMQGRPEGGGSFGNGLLHSRLLPRTGVSYPAP